VYEPEAYRELVSYVNTKPEPLDPNFIGYCTKHLEKDRERNRENLAEAAITFTLVRARSRITRP
jgi:hypothetical protein